MRSHRRKHPAGVYQILAFGSSNSFQSAIRWSVATCLVWRSLPLMRQPCVCPVCQGRECQKWLKSTRTWWWSCFRRHRPETPETMAARVFGDLWFYGWQMLLRLLGYHGMRWMFDVFVKLTRWLQTWSHSWNGSMHKGLVVHLHSVWISTMPAMFQETSRCHPDHGDAPGRTLRLPAGSIQQRAEAQELSWRAAGSAGFWCYSTRSVAFVELLAHVLDHAAALPSSASWKEPQGHVFSAQGYEE